MPPTDFSISQFGFECILVTWTPAASADDSTKYIIYYETMDESKEILAPGTSNIVFIVSVTFGATYQVSIAAQSDFQSPPLGPKEITIGEY